MLAFHLHQLQQIDSERDRLAQAIAKLQQALEDKRAIAQAEAALEAARREMEAAQQALRRAEAEAEAVRAKRRRSEAALYGGTVREPKALQDLQREVEALKRLLTQREDAQIEAMLVAEEAESAYRAAHERLETMRHERLQQESRWQGELDRLQQDLARLDKRRQALAAEVPADALEVYERLRSQRGGLAVAAIDDHTCSACGAPLTPDLVRAARSGESLVFCRTCKRILAST